MRDPGFFGFRGSKFFFRLLKLAQQGDASACDQLIGHYAIPVNFQEWKGNLKKVVLLVVDGSEI